MPEKQGGLSLRIGLTLSQLQSDFLAAEQTIKQGVASLNRQQNLVKIRMDTDIAGLDSVADKTKILEVRERGLTQLLEMQRDKLTLATAAYRDYVASRGASDVGAKKLETAMERERLAVARLEAELKNLSTQKISLDTTQLQSNIAKLNAQIQHVKIKAEIDTSQLSGVNSAFDAHKIHIAAVTRELELQRQKLVQLREAMNQSARNTGGESVATLNIKSNVLTQIQEIQRLEQKLKELQNTNVDLKIRAENAQKIEQTIGDTLSRINATVGLIRVKTEVDTSKISGATAEFDKAKRQVTALNQELTLQNRKLAEMQRLLSQSSGTKAINLAADIQRQIQEIDRLKAKIAELSKIKPPKSGGLLGGYVNIKGDISGKLNEISGAFSQLKGATASADSAIISVLGAIDAIPSPVGKAATALAGLPIIFKGIENSIVNMTKAAASAGDSVYVMSRGFQMSFADTAKFTTNAKVAGVEVNDLAGTIKFLQRQIARGGEDNRAAEWLRRYGESAYNASGNLKNLNEMTFALSRALKKAQAEGKGSDFIFNVFRNVSADAITAIEDIEAVSEQASHIVKNGLANPALAHEVQGNLNAMNVQAGQMNAAFESALLPVANEIIPRMTERMGKFTTLIADNKDLILSFGRDLAEVWGAVENAVDKAAEGFEWLAEQARKNRVVRQTSTKDLVEKYKEDATIKTAEDILKREILSGGYTAEDVAKLQQRPDLYQKELKTTNQDFKALMDERRKIFAEQNLSILDNHKYDKGIKSATDLLKNLTEAEKKALEDKPSPFFDNLIEKVAALRPKLKELHDEAENTKKELESLLKKPLSGADSSGIGQERKSFENNDDLIKDLREARKYYEEAQALRYKSSHGDYENQKYDLDRWLQEQLPRDTEQSTEKYKAVMEEYAAKSEQIEQERADKLAEIRQRITADEQTESEKRMAAIDAEKEKWIQVGMDAAEAEQLAQKQKADYIKGVEQELSAALDELHQSNLEKRLAQIEQEKQAWIDKGAAEVKATQWAEQQKADAQRQAAMNVLKSQGKEYAAYQRGGLEGLEAYKRKQLRKSGVRSEFLDMTPEQLRDFQRANDFADKSLLPNFMTDYDRDRYNKFKNGQPLDEPAAEALTKSLTELPTAVQGASESLSEMSPAVQNVTESLSELPTAISQLTENLAELSTADKDEVSAESSLYESLSQLEPEIENVTVQLSAMTEELSLMAEAAQSATESLSKITQPAEQSAVNPSSQSKPDENAASNPFLKLEPEITSVVKQLSSMNTRVQGTTKDFSGMSTRVQASTKDFSSMSTGLQQVTVKVNALAVALQELTSRAKQKEAEKQPVEVSTSVSINEATAWDSEHIQQLADKVADKIKDAVVNAIGGDSNSY